MKPLLHAKISVKNYGGCVEDYIEIHNFIDSSKIAMADVRHRALLHNSFGCYLAERIFGTHIVNSSGNDVSVRDIAEEHISQDMGGRIPTVSEWLQHIEIQPWMKNERKRKSETRIDYD